MQLIQDRAKQARPDFVARDMREALTDIQASMAPFPDAWCEPHRLARPLSVALRTSYELTTVH